MLAVGRALMLNPLLLMLDEPTQGLGSDHGAAILSVLQSLKGHLPMICVEQNRGFLEEFADTVLTMKGSRLTQTGRHEPTDRVD